MLSRLLKAGRWSGGIRPYHWEKQDGLVPRLFPAASADDAAPSLPSTRGTIPDGQGQGCPRDGVEPGGEAAQRENEAYLRGLADGEARIRAEAEALRQSLAAAEASLADSRQRVAELTEALEKGVSQLWQAVESSLADVAIAVARRILRRELSLSPEDVVPMVAALIKEIRPGGGVRILANPGDAVFLAGGMEELQAALDMQQSLEVIPDPRVEPGGVVIESPEGVWDAGVETQLGCLKEAMERAVEGGHEPGHGG